MRFSAIELLGCTSTPNNLITVVWTYIKESIITRIPKKGRFYLFLSAPGNACRSVVQKAECPGFRELAPGGAANVIFLKAPAS